MTGRYAAIALHLDSMAHAAGYPKGYADPTYHQVIDRFLELARRFGFQYSMFAIGRDLEDQSACHRLRALSRAGHEIGNHTWNHFTDFGALPAARMRQEIVRTHDRLLEVTGVAPKGFISPAWSYSGDLTKLLRELGYSYDTSLFPSLLYYPFVAKNAWNHLGHKEKLWRVLNRRDWLQPLTASREPFVDHGVVMLPVPVSPGPLGLAVWHTTGFVLGWERHLAVLRQALTARRFFHYVVHPADLTCDADLTGRERLHLERAGGSLSEKMSRLHDSLSVIADAGHEWATLGEMADAVRTEFSPLTGHSSQNCPAESAGFQTADR